MTKPRKPPIWKSMIRKCPTCGVDFSPNSMSQKYCNEHKYRNAKRDIDRRKLRSAERSADYYKPKACEEPDCGVEFIPRTGSAKYCKEHQGGSWERHNPEKKREMARRNVRRYRHARDFGDARIYEKLVERDGEQCGICGRIPEPGWHLAVDHCHNSGEIRGLLCPRCNTGLGYFEHEPGRLQSAAGFLLRHALD